MNNWQTTLFCSLRECVMSLPGSLQSIYGLIWAPLVSLPCPLHPYTHTHTHVHRLPVCEQVWTASNKGSCLSSLHVGFLGRRARKDPIHANMIACRVLGVLTLVIGVWLKQPDRLGLFTVLGRVNVKVFPSRFAILFWVGTDGHAYITYFNSWTRSISLSTGYAYRTTL